MEKTNQNLLQKLTQILNVDKIMSPDDVLAIRDALIGVLANNKKELESLTDETKQAVNSILDKVLNEHGAYLEKTKQIAQEAKSETTEAINSTLKSLEEVKALCKEVMECKPENGEDADEEYVIGEVLNRIKLPEYKEIVLDDGGAIVDKINSLPVNEENQIDAKHIKNLPEGKGGRVISGGVTRKIVEQMIEAAGGGGTPGGSTTQLQYNNAGSFGGISGATTDGTAVTYTANNLKAADITASGSGGFLIQSNSGTDVGLFGAGGGAGATFYGGVNIDGSLTVDTNTLYVDATNNRVGVGNTSPATTLDVTGAISMRGAGNNRLLAYSNDGTIRTQLFSFDGLGGFIGTQSNHPLFFRTNDTTRMALDSTGLGIATTAPTHSLTLSSTSTGIALYNTADQTTNYERGRLYWNSNVLTLTTDNAGSGTARSLILTNGANRSLTISPATSAVFQFAAGSSGLLTGAISVTNSTSLSSGTYTQVALTPTINQSSTAGYTALLVNPTETTVGNGTKLLADFQVGGVSKFSVANTGIATHTNTNDAAASNQVLVLQGDRATPANNDEIYQSFLMSSSTGVQREFGRISTRVNSVTNGSEAGMLLFAVINSGSLSDEMRLTASALFPSSNDGLGLGTATSSWSDLFLASGGVINWNNGNATLTHSTGLLTSNVPIVAPQIINTPATITVTSNAGTVTRANRINNFTNSSAATMTITMSTTSAADGDSVIVRIKDFSAAAQTITWVNTENSTVTAPTTSNGSTTLPLTVGFMYNSATSKWRCIASA